MSLTPETPETPRDETPETPKADETTKKPQSFFDLIKDLIGIQIDNSDPNDPKILNQRSNKHFIFFIYFFLTIFLKKHLKKGSSLRSQLQTQPRAQKQTELKERVQIGPRTWDLAHLSRVPIGLIPQARQPIVLRSHWGVYF